jgi:REP element-mobilizing transposase RayT
MPRLARLDAPGILHHVMIRGIERRKIFRDDKDRENILERLSVLLSETKTICYAWALMPNHAHFLFRSGDSGLSTLMMKLLTGYAVSFNRRHKRHGQLFQNRYKSIICQEDQYLIELVRYIHLNPLRAKLVKDMASLNKYPYCGHSALTGKYKREWQDVKYILRLFGRRFGDAKKRYLEYVKEGIAQGRRPELVGGGLIRSLGGWEAVKKIRMSGQDRIKSDQRILGESDFVMEVLEEANEKFERFYELKRKGYNLEKIEQRIKELYDIEKSDIYSRGRRKVQVEARSLFCYWAVCELGISRTYLAKRLDMTQPGVGYAVNRGEKLSTENDFKLIP